MNALYFECHVTIDPVVGDRLWLAKALSTRVGFKVAELMKATGEASDKDSFMTGHAGPGGLHELQTRMAELLHSLTTNGFNVRRHKIEAVIEDSRAYGKSKKA